MWYHCMLNLNCRMHDFKKHMQCMRTYCRNISPGEAGEVWENIRYAVRRIHTSPGLH